MKKYIAEFIRRTAMVPLRDRLYTDLGAHPGHRTDRYQREPGQKLLACCGSGVCRQYGADREPVGVQLLDRLSGRSWRR